MILFSRLLISKSKVLIVITDNGSNTVKAIRIARLTGIRNTGTATQRGR